MEVDPLAWRGCRVLLTGHTGFKGAWMALWLERLGAEVTGLALAPADDRGAWPALAPWNRVESSEADLRDRAAVNEVVARTQPDVVFHMAAQATVAGGFEDPVGTYATNVLGTVNLLDALRRIPCARAVVVVTSDKVYENAGGNRAFREGDRLAGADPYSGSKVCVELAVAAWREWLVDEGEIRIATARAGNVLGGGDRGRGRLAPDIQEALTSGVPLRLRHPDATRPWQFVLDPLRGYLILAQHLLTGRDPVVAAMNFGPTEEHGIPVHEVVERTLALWGGGKWEHAGPPTHREAPFLRLDSSLAREVLQWRPLVGLDQALEWTAEWWRLEAEGGDLRALAVSQLEAYTGISRP